MFRTIDIKLFLSITTIALSTIVSQPLKAQTIIWGDSPIEGRICYVPSNDSCANITSPNTDIPQEDVPVAEPNDANKDRLDPYFKNQIIRL
jgi:hypothetical protein